MLHLLSPANQFPCGACNGERVTSAQTDFDEECLRAWVIPWVGSPVTLSRLTGGWTSTMLRLSGQKRCAVARLMTREPWRTHGAELTTREHQVQQMLARTDVPAPTSIALDSSGEECGVPAHVMSLLPGAVDINRADRASLTVLATALAQIHQVQATIPVRRYESWAWEAKFVVPDWSRDPNLWHSAFNLLRHHEPPSTDSVFLHRDFQPRNVLWDAGRVSGIVDWVEASIGPRWLDVAHCSTHLAIQHDSSVGQEFGRIYAAFTDATPQPYLDVMDIVGNLPAPGRKGLITDMGQLHRLEEHLRAVLTQPRMPPNQSR